MLNTKRNWTFLLLVQMRFKLNFKNNLIHKMTNYWSIQLEFDFSCRSFSQFTSDFLYLTLFLRNLRNSIESTVGACSFNSTWASRAKTKQLSSNFLKFVLEDILGNKWSVAGPYNYVPNSLHLIPQKNWI